MGKRGREAEMLEMHRDMVWSREVVGVEQWSHIHMWWIKIRRNTLGVSDPSPKPDFTAQGSSTRKINSQNF